MTADAVDLLVLAPHPDDAEMACGGTILAAVERGARVAVADLTAGEASTKGDVAERAVECRAATELLGVHLRETLGLPDAGLQNDLRTLVAVVGVLRRRRPRVLLAPLDRDLHPDHQATGQAARRAWFVAGLARAHPELGPAHRPELLLHYPLHHDVAPSLCVDISAYADRKLAALRCYRSQIGGDRSHLARLDVLERATARDAFWGAQIGVRAAEPLWSEGPLRIGDLLAALCP